MGNPEPHRGQGTSPVVWLLLVGESGKDGVDDDEVGCPSGDDDDAAGCPPTPRRPFIMAYCPRICCCHTDIAARPFTETIKLFRLHGVPEKA